MLLTGMPVRSLSTVRAAKLIRTEQAFSV